MRANCLIVALWVWIASRGRASLWVRRSTSFLGLIPHFGTTHRTGSREIVTLQYTPVKSELGTSRNLILLFRGRYKVTRWRAVEHAVFPTLKEAQEWMNRKTP